jgi:1-acyl-sn-glycerol-3-phosphate acyltransferase
MGSASPARTDAEPWLAAREGHPPPVSPVGWCRLAARTGWLVALLLVTVPLHYLWRALRLGSPWPRLFLGWGARVCGARVKRVGTPLKRDVFFIANHLSWIDILAVGGASGSAFVSKAELRDAPVVGWLATLNKTVFVSREDKLGVAEQIADLREALAENWSVTVFPEGTTTDGASLLPFRTSLLQVLDPPPPGVMVQPVWLDFHAAGPEIAWLGVETGKDNAIRVMTRRGSFPVTITFLEPFSPADFPGRKTIAAEAKRRIAVAMELSLDLNRAHSPA